MTLRDGQGMAPGAKLAVLDVGTSSSSDQVLGGHMWEASFGTGAMVHSGSWGFPDEPCTVDEATVSFDTWAYEVRRGWGKRNGLELSVLCCKCFKAKV